MMSDIDNLDVMLGSGNENPIERELADAIEQSSVQGDYEANEYQRDSYRIFAQENESLRKNEARQSFENFTSEFNLRLSQEMDSMMSMVHSQINRAINTAISERVIPEIQNIVSSMSSSGNRDNEASMSPCSQENRENPSGLRSKISKKDSRSVGDLRDTTASGQYICLNEYVHTLQEKTMRVILVTFFLSARTDQKSSAKRSRKFQEFSSFLAGVEFFFEKFLMSPKSPFQFFDILLIGC